jgi:excisionase family DNA binding protein
MSQYKIDNDTRVYNLKDLSEILGIGIRTLRRYIKNGDLRAKKIGKSYLVTESNLLEFLEPEK